MYFNSHDISLYYEKYGNDSTNALVILPGWGDTRKTFNYYINEFAKEKTVYIIDYPGFGNTNFPNHDLTIYDYALLIKEFLEQEELIDPILLGHSFGGRLIILLLGYYHYSCSKAILMDSAGIIPKRTLKSKIKSTWYRFLKKLKIFLPTKRQKKYLEWLLQKFGSVDYRTLPPQMRKTFSQVVTEDLFPYLKEISASTLLLWGENDPSTPLSDGKIMNQEIKNSGLVVIPKTGHFPYLDNSYYVLIVLKNFI